LGDVVAAHVAVARLRTHLLEAKQAQEAAVALLPDALALLGHVAAAAGHALRADHAPAWLAHALPVASAHNVHTATLVAPLRALLPAALRAALDRWNAAKPVQVGSLF